MLADLCRECATNADSLLDQYGGRGRDAISLVQEIDALPPRPAVPGRVVAHAGRLLAYLAIAASAFLLVTVIVSRGR